MSDPIQKKRGNPNMVAGGKSLNPNGRPRVGESLAEAFRDKCSPERIAEMVIGLAESAASEQVRLAAIQFIAERAHGKVTTGIDMNIGVTPEQQAHLEALKLSPHQRRQRLAELGEETDEPSPVVDDGVDDE